MPDIPEPLPEYIPDCPLCGGPMTRRISSKTGTPFFGCNAFVFKDERHCDGTIDIPASPESVDTVDRQDWRWRRDAALAITLAAIQNWHNLEPGQLGHAEYGCRTVDQLIEELRK